MNENEISRIAAAISDLRPDWPAASLRTLLHSPELKNRPRRDVAVAMAWIACDSETKTPKRVLEAGPWWKAACVETPEAVGVRPPKRDEACLTCGRHLERCICGEQQTRPVERDPEVAKRGAARARELLHPPIVESPEYAEAASAAHPTTEENA